MDEKDKRTIPWFSHEAEVFRLERTIHRLWIFGLVIFFAFTLSNLIWLQYEMQYSDNITTVTQDLDSADGDAVISGDVNINGEGKADNNG